MAQSSTTKARIQLPTWWGNRQDLARLISLVQALHSSASAEVESRLRASKERARAINAERVESLAVAIASNISKNGGKLGRFDDPKALRDEVRFLEMMEEDGDYKAARAVKELELEMTVYLKAWDERRTGAPEALIENLDEREIKRIELSFGQQYSGGTFLRLELGKDGSHAELGGPVDWVSSAAGQLTVELKRQSSWLGHLFQGWAQTLLSVVCGLLIVLMVAPYFKSATDLVLITLGLNAPIILAITFLLQKVVPRFELRKEGKPKVKVWIGWVAGLLVTVLIGLGTNALSKLMGI